MNDVTGCGDNSCKLVKPVGMATNGGCRCFDGLPQSKRINIQRFIWLKDKQISDLEAKLEHLGIAHKTLPPADH